MAVFEVFFEHPYTSANGVANRGARSSIPARQNWAAEIFVESGRVAPGDCSLGAPTDPYVPCQAYGSSHHEFATGRHTEWIGIGGGSGYGSSNRRTRAHEMVLWR